MNHFFLSLIVIVSFLCVGCAQDKCKDDCENAISSSENEVNWSSYGNDLSEKRFSPIAQINTNNVKSLGLDWSLDLSDAIQFVSTPLAIEGVLYFSGDRSIVRAVDGASGELLWTFDPQIHLHSPRTIALGWNVNRGLAYLDGKLFIGATDGRLIAIDSVHGKQLWSTKTFEPTESKAITGAPRAFNNMVVIGHGGAEYGTRGYVSAYDADSGEQLWRFYTVPGNPSHGFENSAMEMAAATWFGEWWKTGGGGTVWDGITYDEELDQLYIGVGNGDPWDYDLRSDGKGDNLFLGSIVALDPNTGEYLWHYQSLPGERWDFKSTQDMILTDLLIGGKNRKVLMQAHMNGHFYILDRNDGQLLSAEKYAKSTWADYIDLDTGRPVLSEEAKYRKGGASRIWPSPFGARNWQSSSYNPETGLVYIAETQLGGEFSIGPDPEFRDKFLRVNILVDYSEVTQNDGTGSLLAWDPLLGEMAWQVRHSSFWNGGTLSTAGDLVFQGNGEGYFQAYHAHSGELLWEIDAQRGINAPPISFTVDGEQHIAILVGWGGLSSFGLPVFSRMGWKYKAPGIRLLSFSLSGKAELPAINNMRHQFTPAATSDTKIDIDKANAGNALYHNSGCGVCHGGGLNSAGSGAPDLRESLANSNYSYFKAVVADGALLPNGMPQFTDLEESEVLAIYEYMRQQTRAALNDSRLMLPEYVEIKSERGRHEY